MKRDKTTKNSKNNSNSGLPVIDSNAINQTIIINNPNFNINYIDTINHNPEAKNQNATIYQNSFYDPKNTSKGIDAWKLNNNLKEFSETRQLGFFKPNQTKKQNLKESPYIAHKGRTAEIKSQSKISPSPIHFRENRTLSTIKKLFPQLKIHYSMMTLRKLSGRGNFKTR